MKKIFLIIIGFALFGLVGCNKQTLNLKPLNAYTDASVWSSLTTVQVFVNQQYQVLPGFQVPYSNLTLNLSSISADAYDRFNNENCNVVQQGDVTPSNESSFADLGEWQNLWGYVKNCNLFFSKIKSVPGDTALKHRMYGEVQFLRAWTYFELIKRYGGVPIITKVFKVGGNYKETRQSYDACTNFIVSQLDSAATELPVSYPSDELGRATKGAALGLKSRVLLFDASALNNSTNDKSKWQQAADAAKAVMDMGTYQLYQGSDYTGIFLNNWNSSIVFARNQSSDYNQDSWHALTVAELPNGYHGWSDNAPSQNLVNAFPMANGKAITDPTSGYDPTHPYQNRDPRFYADIVYNNEMLRGRHVQFYIGGMDSEQGGIDTWNASKTGYTLNKFVDPTISINSNKLSNREFPLIRMAEIYLNYAEAEYHLGNETIARQTIDQLRARPSVNLPALPSTLTGSDLLDAIRTERRLDLCFEGHHYWDLLRWKLAMTELNGSINGVVITKNQDGSFSYQYQQVIPLTFHSQMYRFPIPYDEIVRTGLQQNPGY